MKKKLPQYLHNFLVILKQTLKGFRLGINPVGVVIIVSVFFVTVKVSHISQFNFFSTAVAAEKKDTESAKKDNKKKNKKTQMNPNKESLKEKTEKKTKVISNILGGAISASSDGAMDYSKFDPSKITAEELDLLFKLNKRRKEIMAKTKKIEEKKHAMGALHKTLDEKITILRRLKKDVDGALRNSKNREQKNIEKLVIMYETMKPKSAAAIFNGLNVQLVYLIMERMQRNKASLILASMRPERARMITQKLALERNVDKSLQKYRNQLGE